MIDDTNPFVYSHPLAAEDVIDREPETHELLTKVVGGHYVRLYAPRKYGKTSLLLKALLDGAREEGLIPVHVDLYRAMSIADVAVRLERAYSKHLKGALRGKIDSFLKTTGVGLSLGAYGISAKLQLDSKADPLPALHTLLALPLELEKHGGYRACIALGEREGVPIVTADRNWRDILPGLEVIELHGHSAGQVGYWWPEKRLLFGGDVLMHMPWGITLPIPGVTPDIAEAKRSFRKVAEMDVDILCFGHGAPLLGNAAAAIRAFAEKIKP